MRGVSRVVMLTIAVLSVASAALGQQARNVGIVMGFPAAAGVLWNVSDGFALRPDVAVTHQSTETTSSVILGLGSVTQTVTSTSDGWATSAGISALFFFGAPDALRFYLTPRVAYVWTRSETESEPASLTQLGAYESKTDGFLVAGSFGAQYAPHDRFRLFGELGLTYTRQDGFSGYSISRSDTVTTSAGLRSGVGVVVLF
jgi:hypothetical protein